MSIVPTPVGTIRRVRAEHVIVDQQMIEANPLDRLDEVAQRDRIGAGDQLGKGDAETDVVPPRAAKKTCLESTSIVL